MKINIPNNLYQDFLNFLDIAQASFTDEIIDSCSDNEKEVIKFIEKLLGENRSIRFKTNKEKNSAEEDFLNIVG